MKHDKKGFIFLCLIGSLVLNGTSVCYASNPVDHGESQTGANGAAAWEEDYTDTDTEKGMLAVRGEVFEGFHGEVMICFMGVIGGRRFDVILDKAGDYMTNLSLTGETYKVTGVTAISELRGYDCYADPVTVEITAGAVSACNVYVSVQKFPEEKQVQQTEPAVGSKAAEPKAQTGTEEQAEQAVLEETTGEKQHQDKMPILGVLGLALILVCVGSLICIQKREK